MTRFAPSPNGPLHLGHAYSAIVSHDMAASRGGRFLLRIEDIDGVRSRPELPEEFRADLAWLGLEWEEVASQSARLASYRAAADTLRGMGLLYPCDCTRADIAAAATAEGPDGPVYPGTCRDKDIDLTGAVAWRLDAAEALRRTGPLVWHDERIGREVVTPVQVGDVVLVSKDPDTPASYHLAVTLDDAADGVTLVTRGLDLLAATPIHRVLQALLGLPVPEWHHHALLTERDGRKLSKRRGSPSLADRRRAGEDGRALAEDLRNRRLPTGIRLSETLHPGP